MYELKALQTWSQHVSTCLFLGLEFCFIVQEPFRVSSKESIYNWIYSSNSTKVLKWWKKLVNYCTFNNINKLMSVVMFRCTIKINIDYLITYSFVLIKSVLFICLDIDRVLIVIIIDSLSEYCVGEYYIILFNVLYINNFHYNFSYYRQWQRSQKRVRKGIDCL